MSAELVSILVLIVVFVIAITRSINMGAVAFAAAFSVGTLVGDFDTKAILAGFPSELFVVLVGVTFLFAIARANGTIDWLVHGAIRMVGGRVVLVPWIMFAVTGALTAIGAVSPAAVAIVAPIALSFAARSQISPLLMGAMVIHGAQAGGFSPISVYGTVVNSVVTREGLPGNEFTIFIASLIINLAIAVIVFVMCGGPKLAKVKTVQYATAGAAPDRNPGVRGQSTGTAGDSTEPSMPPQVTRPVMATVASILVLVACALILDLDVGLTAITLAVLLSIVWPTSAKEAVAHVTWPTVLLICGVLTYIGVLQRLGTIDYAGNAVTGIGVPLLAALVLCYIGAIVSAFASSVGVLGALIPLAVPFLLAGSIDPVQMVAALAVAATVVDVSPFSTNGALVLANAQNVDRDAFFRQLMIYGAIVVAAAPAAVWLVMILPT